jgi:hypothetical protein
MFELNLIRISLVPIAIYVASYLWREAFSGFNWWLDDGKAARCATLCEACWAVIANAMAVYLLYWAIRSLI